MEGETATQRWWSNDSVALVTGANKGLGLQLVREFAKRGFTTILTSRNEENGKKAIELLHSEGIPDVAFYQLDVTSSEDVHKLADWLSQTYGGIDILVNNAAVSTLSFADEGPPSVVRTAKEVLDTNYYGAKAVIEAVSPVMKPGGRIINVCSAAGDLNHVRNEWRTKLDGENISTLTPEAVDEFANSFLQAAEKGEVQAGGWPWLGTQMGFNLLSDYSTSKIALAAYSRILAPKLKSESNVSINCMCPGGTSTSMTGFRGHSVEVGADTVVWLALQPEVETGRFYVGRKDVGFSNLPLNMNGVLKYDWIVEFKRKAFDMVA